MPGGRPGEAWLPPDPEPHERSPRMWERSKNKKNWGEFKKEFLQHEGTCPQEAIQRDDRHSFRAATGTSSRAKEFHQTLHGRRGGKEIIQYVVGTQPKLKRFPKAPATQDLEQLIQKGMEVQDGLKLAAELHLGPHPLC